VDADDEVFVKGEEGFAVVGCDRDGDVAGVVVEIDDLADDAPGAGIPDLETDERILVLGILVLESYPAANQLFGLFQRIDIFELDDEPVALRFDRFKIKRNRQSIEFDEYRFLAFQIPGIVGVEA